MPTWGEILEEVKASAAARGGNPDIDGIRRKYLAKLHELTGRDTIVYYTNWMTIGGPATSISLEDMQGMMEVNKGLKGESLDLLLHSPGGSAEDTASLVRYLRTKYKEVRAFVPLAAMSAATMWALAADEIVMGAHSQLGPIDPQVNTPQGQFPARAIIDQFERAKEECSKDPSLLGAWLPILQQYGTGLLEQCETAEKMARRLVTTWLGDYMLADQANARRKAAAIARWFSTYGASQSHRLGIDRDLARSKGVRVTDLENDQALQDAVLSVHHAVMHTFQGSVVKLIENHIGKAFVQSQQVVQVPVQVAAPVQPTQ